MAPPRSRALARRRTSSRAGSYSGQAAVKLRNARSALSRQRKKYQESANKAQYAQLGWTMVGGAGGGFASAQFPDGIMGIDTRLVGGIALAAGCILLKSPGVQRPLCGLASGMLAAYLSDTTESLFATDTIPDSEV